MHDIGVSQVFLIECNDATFSGELGLKVGVSGGQRNASVSDFDDEVGNLKALTNSSGGGRHVSREPVDHSAAGVEAHFSQPFLYESLQPSHYLSPTRSSTSSSTQTRRKIMGMLNRRIRWGNSEINRGLGFKE